MHCINIERNIILSYNHQKTRICLIHGSLSFCSREQMMRARRTLTPSQEGTKKLLRQYGSQLVCIRYRYDVERWLRFKRVELIIEQAPWSPTPASIAGTTLVGVRVGAKEVELQRQVKQAGGRWNPTERVWEIP